MEPFLLNLIPADKLIHITAAYSNAVLLVILTNVSDFAKKLDLPIPQPVTATQVQKCFINPIMGANGGLLTLTNGDLFHYYDTGGYVSSFRAYKNPMQPPDDLEFDDLEKWIPQFYGTMNMTTNEVIEFAREALRKLGHDPKKLHADIMPTRFDGPGVVHGTNTIPFCDVEWRDDEENNSIRIGVNAEKKQIVRFYLSLSTNIYPARPALKLDVVPELERDYRKRTQGTMFLRSNAPPPARLTNSPSQLTNSGK